MANPLIDIVEKSSMKDKVPEYHIGDTVDVTCRIVEGGRQRLQNFTGTVIARRGQGINETITVRRIVNNEGVERVFMVHSPRIAGIKVRRRGKVRRAKLYYLRERVGKARRLKELRISTGKGRRRRSKAAPNRAESPESPATEAEAEATAEAPTGA